MSKLIDIVFDLETVALCPTAAPMQIAACAFSRDNLGEFITDNDGRAVILNEGVDLTTAVMAGLTFDSDTINFWTKQKEAVQLSVMQLERHQIEYVPQLLVDYARKVMKLTEADKVCIWCQGTDFDVAILRNIAYLFRDNQEVENDITWPWKHTQYRDCRTYIQEMGKMLFDLNDVDVANHPRLVYDKLPQFETEQSMTHDALYDSMKSAWSVMQLMQVEQAHRKLFALWSEKAKKESK